MRNDSPGVPVPRAEWSVVAHRRGLPWWGAVAVAVVLTALGAALDLVLGDTLTAIFQVFYVVGCVAAVLAVAQRGLFAAMVQPPLVLAVAVPSVVLLLGGTGDTSTRGKVIATVIPLINGFPTMAVATLVTLAIGIVRFRVRRAARPAHTSRAASRPTPRTARSSSTRRSDPRRAAAGRGGPADDPRAAQPGDPSAAAPRGSQRGEGPRRDTPGRDPRPRRERPAPDPDRRARPEEPLTSRAGSPRSQPWTGGEPRGRTAQDPWREPVSDPRRFEDRDRAQRPADHRATEYRATEYRATEHRRSERDARPERRGDATRGARRAQPPTGEHRYR